MVSLCIARCLVFGLTMYDGLYLGQIFLQRSSLSLTHLQRACVNVR